MVKARKYVVMKHFQGVPKKSDFEIIETELPALKSGEILVKAEFISVDPYIRSFNRRNSVPYDQFSFQVGIVQESQHKGFAVGDRVVSHRGWMNYYIADPDEPEEPYHKIYKLPDLGKLPKSIGIGAIGMPGATAYFGFLEVCKPKTGETVVVSGAAGAVGSVVGQIAKIKGCRVIGFTGSDSKVDMLEKELGFDKAFNYKKVNITEALKEAAPNGVDCYFDTVGGEQSSEIINQMNSFGRVSVCGSTSSYNEDPSQLPKATILQPSILYKRLTIQGFLVYEWWDRWSEAINQLTKWVTSGQLKAKEHVTEGFDNLFDALLGMLNGDNLGKTVVKV